MGVHHHGSVGSIEIPCKVLEFRGRAFSDIEDPLRRFEYLRTAKPSAVMIRATPNSVRWDEINRVQYRFQALNFHSDVLEALIHNSPPLSRRERALTSPGKKTTQVNSCSLDSAEEKKEPTLPARVRCIRRSASFDSSNDPKSDYLSKRKGSVVQILKDDTSDYNSDEEVFAKSESGSMEKINYNATLVHVENRHITDTTEINVSNFTPQHSIIDEQCEICTLDLSDNVRTDQVDRGCIGTHVFSHNDSVSSGYASSTNTCGGTSDQVLHQKSKEELVEMVKQLQEELHHQSTELPENIPSSSERRKRLKPQLVLHSPLTSIDLNGNEKLVAVTTEASSVTEEPLFSVSVMVNKLEPKKSIQSIPKPTPSRTYQLTSPSSGRVRNLSAAFEREFEANSQIGKKEQSPRPSTKLT